MKTLLEKLLIEPGITEELKDQLRKAIVIKVDNVAEYLWVNKKNERQALSKLTIRDFPNLVPPFLNMFIEWREPYGELVESKTKIEKILHRKLKMSNVNYETGLLFQATENKESEDRWSIKVDIFFGDCYGFEPFVYKVKKDGELFCKEADFFKNIDVINDEEIDGFKMFGDRYDGLIQVGFLTISLMHCRNVEIIPRGGGIDRKPGKRNRHDPRMRYHVLAIEPMKKILRMEGESEKLGLKQALHICRGHWKDYREGKGLFGKYHDLIWWQEHVKGSIFEGIIIKDYRINLDDGILGDQQ